MTISRIQVRETNCYLVSGREGTVLIDPGPPGGAAIVVAGAEAAGIRPEAVRLIVVTHGHLDHYGAAAQVKAWCGAPVAAHYGAPAFSQDRRNALPPAQTLRGSLIRWIYLLLAPAVAFAPLEADLLLDEESDLSPYGIDARTVPVPGHSPDSLAVFTGAGDAFAGDLYVNYTAPSQPMYLSDRGAWKKSHARIQALRPHTVYVGHGEPFAGDRLNHIYPARYQLRWWVR